MAQAQEVAEFVQNKHLPTEEPVFLAGDFNLPFIENATSFGACLHILSMTTPIRSPKRALSLTGGFTSHSTVLWPDFKGYGQLAYNRGTE